MTDRRGFFGRCLALVGAARLPARPVDPYALAALDAQWAGKMAMLNAGQLTGRLLGPIIGPAMLPLSNGGIVRDWPPDGEAQRTDLASRWPARPPGAAGDALGSVVVLASMDRPMDLRPY